MNITWLDIRHISDNYTAPNCKIEWFFKYLIFIFTTHEIVMKGHLYVTYESSNTLQVPFLLLEWKMKSGFLFILYWNIMLYLQKINLLDLMWLIGLVISHRFYTLIKLNKTKPISFYSEILFVVQKRSNASEENHILLDES